MLSRIMNRKLLRAGIAAAVLCAAAAALWIIFLYLTLPDISRLKRYRPPAATEVFDRHGELLAQYHDRVVRFWVPVASVPDHVIWSVVIAEDDTFFEHRGFNFKATWDALVQDVRKRRFARGGSTITQQMIKNVLLSREKTIARKLREYFLARKAEEILTKREIMEIYLNEVEWGDGLHGIEAASRYYFDKHADELGLAEASLLAGMLPNPRYYDPFRRLEKAKGRQERVLSNMHQAKLITADEFEAARSGTPHLRQGASDRFGAVLRPSRRPCSALVLENVLLAAFGEDALYRRGMKIRTTLDKGIQDALQQKERMADDGQDVPDTIFVLREGEEVRAFSCSANGDGVSLPDGTPAVSPPQELLREAVPASSLDAAALGIAGNSEQR